jgi:beta-N-acetylhexosaminidase
MKKLTLLILIILNVFQLKAQKHELFINTIDFPNQWVDSVFKTMNRKEKIGQLFMVRAHTNLGEAYSDSVASVIKKQHLGGVVFFQGGPTRQAILTNKYQSLSSIPLMVAIDAEWGLGMRLDSTISYPFQMTLGAINNNELIYEMGQDLAKDLKRMGIHINFAPVMDINNNPSNPVINFRSFGENKLNVTNKSIAYMKGMQDAGIFTTAKHFPGHGDTNVDSHYDLPLLNFSKERLDSLEIYPFKKAIAAGLSGVMVAHMNIPSLDNKPNTPSTLSKPIVTGILKNDLGFKGLIFSDAMNMKGVVKYHSNGQADIQALIAGNDVIELSEDTKRAIKLVRKAIRKGDLSKKDVDQKVKKILEAKYWMGLNNYKDINIKNLHNDINRQESYALIQELTDAAITLLKGENLIPLRTDFVKKTAILSIGSKEETDFSSTIKKSIPKAVIFNIPKDINLKDLEKIKADLKNYDQILMAIHDTRPRPAGTLDYNNDLKLFIASVAKLNTYTTVFANAYTIAGLPSVEQSKALLLAYQNSVEMQQSAAKVLNGTLKAKGKLPVTINTFFKYNDGILMK